MRAFLLTAVVLALHAGCAQGGIDRRRGPDALDGEDGGVARTDSGSSDGGSFDAAGADVPIECGSKEMRPCSASCGSTGLQRCAAGRWLGCEPPVEDCNAADDDCDGSIDERIAPRACSAGCGGGSESCASGAWSGCTATDPMPETCNALDDDCDSRVDELLSRACSTACGMGTEACTLGAFTGCTAPAPRAEICNGVDEDCDGAIDDGVTRACSSACGSGIETCASGAFGGCTAPAVPAETCNGLDDDCDGTIDDGFRVVAHPAAPQSELTTAQAACAGPGSGLDVCLTAAHRWCGGRGCTSTGVGILGSGPGTARVVCLASAAATVVATTFTEVSIGASTTIDGSNASSRVALSAANRYCRRTGYEGGFGPVEHSSPDFYVSCVSAPYASYRPIPTADLRARGCDPVITAEPVACATASDQVCRDAGFEGGWGPVEWNDTDSAVVCVRDP